MLLTLVELNADPVRVSERRLSGTSDLKGGQRVAIVLGSRFNAAGLPTLASARGPVISYATVDALGAWTYVGTGPNPQTSVPVASTVTAVSTHRNPVRCRDRVVSRGRGCV